MDEPKKSQARLSDHFHKVRLTSIILSISLFLSTLDRNGEPVLPSLFLKIPREYVPFIILCIAIGATVSFLHAWIIWTADVAKIDADPESASGLAGQLRSTMQETEKTLIEVRDTNASIQNVAMHVPFPVQSLAVLNSEVIQKELNEASVVVHQFKRLSDELQPILDELHRGQPRAEVDRYLAEAVAKALLQKGFAVSADVVAAALEAGLAAPGINVKGWQPTTDVEHARWEGAPILDVVRSYLLSYETRIFTLFESNRQRSTDLERKLDEIEPQLKSSVADFKNLVLPALTNVRSQLSRAFSPLLRAERVSKVEIRVFDLAIPACAYGVGLAHALGRIFGPVLPSAGEVTNDVLGWLSHVGWWAEALAVATILGLIIALVLWVSHPGVAKPS